MNQRTTRKIWLLSCICDFSRYITINPVEDLSKQALLNTFKLHFIRYGVSSRIECDLGTNFVAVKDNLESDHLSEGDIKYITEELKSQGTCLVQRSPRAPWIQGGVERANSFIKRFLPGKHYTLFQLITYLEYVQMVLNRRPLGVRHGEILEPITPADVIPVWSKIQAGLSMANCTKIIEAARKDFHRKWSSLYDLCIL